MSTLAEHLRNLPGFEPPADGWARLQRELSPARRRRRRRLAGGFALAASALIALAAVLSTRLPDTPGPPGDPALAHLMQRSRTLEQDLARLRPQVVVWDGRYAAAAQSIENRLAVVDLQLNYAEPASAQRLWQDRVALMARLVETHEAASLHAAPAQQRPETQEWNL